MNALYIAAVLFGVAWLLRRKPQDARQVSSRWIREQTRSRGLTGYSGAYHEDQ